MMLSKPIVDLLLTYKLLTPGKFAIFRKDKNTGRHCYLQPGKTTAVPDLLGFYPGNGVLIDKDLQKNLEVVSFISKCTDDDTIYVYPSELGFNVLVVSDQGVKVFEGELKLVSTVGFTTWVQLKIIKWKLKHEGNKLYKLF